MSLSEERYQIGPAAGELTRLYAPDGDTWCAFTGGSLECINGEECLNHSQEDKNEDP